MSQIEGLWPRVRRRLLQWADQDGLFRYGQQHSLRWMANRIEQNGIVVADEVGLGKTRLALLAMFATLEEGGEVAAVVPPGLIFQWAQEVSDLSKNLESAAGSRRPPWGPAIVRSFAGIFDALESRGRWPLCTGSADRFALISQAFDLHRSKVNGRAWMIELPALINAHIAEREGAHGNDQWKQYRKGRQERESQRRDSSWWERYDEAAAYLARQRLPVSMRSILNDDRVRPNTDASSTARPESTLFFQIGQDGRKLLQHLVGQLTGRIDLLVIDEAHKSREDDGEEVPKKRLGRLLEQILLTSAETRRISMTATPIELGPEQWMALLERTGFSRDDPRHEGVAKRIERFSEALRQAQGHPDEAAALDRLLSAAREFERALAPRVSRRRRISQLEMQALLPPNPVGAHPHRKLTHWSIKVPELSEDWRRMVLALEGMGMAAKGLGDLGLAQRQTDVRYASGLSIEHDDVPESSDASRKARRAAAWQRMARGLAERMNSRGNDEWLWSHPRVVDAVKAIEEMCALDDWVPREKVLVFGRFSDPIRVLQECLNARQVLRILDRDQLGWVPPPGDESRRILEHWLRRGREQGEVTGKLREPDGLTVAKLLDETRARYRNARASLRRHIDDTSVGWAEGSPGAGALRDLMAHDRRAGSAIMESLRGEVLDHLLWERTELGTVTGSRVAELASQIWAGHCEAMRHSQDEVEASDEVGENRARITEDDLRRNFDIGGGGLGERDSRSNFCRLLDGSVSPEARRTVQAGFNRLGAAPFVIVAQSVVGREGLNLHRACRRVFLFHPEWNPGVMEQQIGRVDRINSRWTELASAWKQKAPGPERGDFPQIEVKSLVFQGTYDEYQFRVLSQRRRTLDAQLFGTLLDEESLERVPEHYRERMRKEAPSWEPPSQAGPSPTVTSSDSADDSPPAQMGHPPAHNGSSQAEDPAPAGVTEPVGRAPAGANS